MSQKFNPMKKGECSDKAVNSKNYEKIQGKTLFEIYEYLNEIFPIEISSINSTFFKNLNIRSIAFIRTLASEDRKTAAEMKKNFDNFYTKLSSSKCLITDEHRFEIEELKKEWDALFPEEIFQSSTKFSSNIVENDIDFNYIDPENNMKECSFMVFKEEGIKDKGVYFNVKDSKNMDLPIINYKEELSDLWETIEKDSLITDIKCLMNLANDSSKFLPMKINKEDGHFQLKMIKNEKFCMDKKEECSAHYYLLKEYLEKMETFKNEIPEELYYDKNELNNLKEFLKDLPIELNSRRIDEVMKETEKLKSFCGLMDEHISKLNGCKSNKKMLLLSSYSTFDYLKNLNDLLHLIFNYQNYLQTDASRIHHQGLQNFKCCNRVIKDKTNDPFNVFYSVKVDEFVPKSSSNFSLSLNNNNPFLIFGEELKNFHEFDRILPLESFKNVPDVILYYSAIYLTETKQNEEEEVKNLKNFIEDYHRNLGITSLIPERNETIAPIASNVLTEFLKSGTTASGTSFTPVKYHEIEYKGNFDLSNSKIEPFLECVLAGIQKIIFKFSGVNNAYSSPAVPLEDCMSKEEEISEALKDIDEHLIEIKKAYKEVCDNRNLTLIITKPPSSSNRLEFYIEDNN